MRPVSSGVSQMASGPGVGWENARVPVKLFPRALRGTRLQPSEDPAAGEGVKQAAFGKNEAPHAASPWRADKSPDRDKAVLEGIVGEEPVFPEAGDEEAGTKAPRPARK